jgi:alkylhydroperoxidase/carboxymuconolactone decarboxylase family protein YurZ
MRREEVEQALNRVRQQRGYVLPVHEMMAELDPELLRRYGDLSAYLLFDDDTKALDPKTRALVLVGITTAVRGDQEGIEVNVQRALAAGATEREVLEAILLAALPAGIPAVEYAARVWQDLKAGHVSTAVDSENPL